MVLANYHYIFIIVQKEEKEGGGEQIMMVYHFEYAEENTVDLGIRKTAYELRCIKERVVFIGKGDSLMDIKLTDLDTIQEDFSMYSLSDHTENYRAMLKEKLGVLVESNESKIKEIEAKNNVYDSMLVTISHLDN